MQKVKKLIVIAEVFFQLFEHHRYLQMIIRNCDHILFKRFSATDTKSVCKSPPLYCF